MRPPLYPPAARSARFCAYLLSAALVCASCDKAPTQSPPGPATSQDDARTKLSPHLTTTLLDLSVAKEDAGKSLALLASSLTADPTSLELREKAGRLLAVTRWHLPEIRIQHPTSIERIHFGTPSQLWVGISGKNKHHGVFSTVIHWDLSPLHIQGILFPSPDTSTRTLVVNPNRRTLVLERGGFLLLCDAQTLQPIREIGTLPRTLNPSSTIVFSADGLLLAHPCLSGINNTPPRWFIRDALAGEIIREYSPDDISSPMPLAAHLDSHALRLIHQNGTMAHIPVSPVGPVSFTTQPQPTQLNHALFTPNGNNAFVTKFTPPGSLQSAFLNPGNRDGFSLANKSLLHRFPWNKHPGIWSGLFRHRIDASASFTRYSPEHAPARTATDITALALCENRLATGDTRGFLTIHHILPVPLTNYNALEPTAFDASSLASLTNLSTALSGISYQAEFRTFSKHTLDERLLAFRNCDFTALAKTFPSLDFTPIIQELQN